MQRSPALLALGGAVVLFSHTASFLAGQAADLDAPKTVILALARLNAEQDFSTVPSFMGHDTDITSSTIGDRGYAGRPNFPRDFLAELPSVDRLEIPIQESKVWRHGSIAWSGMELDSIRGFAGGTDIPKQVLPLRETGVLENRQGRWRLLSWHESVRVIRATLLLSRESSASPRAYRIEDVPGWPVDLSGKWDITEVEDKKHYQATLDKTGNGPYTQHGGQFVTTKFADRRWQGTWHQPGNDREGGFELLLSEDGTQAKGVWWYSRVGRHKNIPPREHGGTYLWKRLTPAPTQP